MYRLSLGPRDKDCLTLQAKYDSYRHLIGRFSLGLLSALEVHLVRICSVNSFLKVSSKSDVRFNRITHLIYLHVEISLENVSKR